MPALRPSSGLENKTNIRPTHDRQTEAWAEDFQELGNILHDHADILDSITGTVSPNPFYGTFDSLATLQSAFPIGEPNAYAIIDAGVGNTPQIAVWNDTTQEWEGGDYTSSVVWLNNIGDRPSAGLENTVYIVKDSGEMWYWYFGDYALLNGQVTNASIEITIEGHPFRFVRGFNNTTGEPTNGDIASGGVFTYQGSQFYGDLQLMDDSADITIGVGTTWKPINLTQI